MENTVASSVSEKQYLNGDASKHPLPSENSHYLPTMYQQYIHISRYSRYLPDKGRRETWVETVARYFDFFERHLKEECGFTLDRETRNELESYVLNLKVMPSMRCLMTAGEALRLESMAGYNCSYTTVDNTKAFSEILYILLCGTGVGFSVERQYVNKLPEVPEVLERTDSIISIGDSRSGWAKGLNQLINFLYDGQIPKWDTSKVRPAGSPLKTFGGRASGPAKLEECFDFIIKIFQQAVGRKLTSIECHDIVCKIAEIVVVGGVRRSALISLSNLSDDRMRHAKSGQWWEGNVQRALANNSVAYTEKPDMGIWMKEWLALYDSKSGERGIFNRKASKKQAAKFGRRDADHDFGTNPCLTGDTRLLTPEGYRSMRELWIESDSQDYAGYVTGLDQYGSQEIVNRHGIVKATNVYRTSESADVYRITLSDGSEIKATENHRFVVLDGNKEIIKQTKELCLEDSLPTAPSEGVFGSFRDFDYALLAGWVIGDGVVFQRRGKHVAGVDVYANDIETVRPQLASALQNVYTRHNQSSVQENSWEDSESKIQNGFNHRKVRMCSSVLGRLLLNDNIVPGSKHKIPTSIWSGDKKTMSAFLRGIFSADGSVQCNESKGCISIRIGQASKALLLELQMALWQFGIQSSVSLRKKADTYPMNNGQGGMKNYQRRDFYELIIGGLVNCRKFIDNIGFLQTDKENKARSWFANHSGSNNSASTIKKYRDIISIEYVGREETFCLTEPENNEISVGLIVTKNCSEIILRPNQLCNLSEVVIRSDDTEETLLKKIEVATIFGTMQSTLLNFKFVNKTWINNCKEERLLGVSLTGIMDNELTSNNTEELKVLLEKMRDKAREVNIEWAKKLGIEESTAITCVKPSGTVSQLVGSASGIHPNYSPYYIRTVRADNMDPLCTLMKELGFPSEPDVTRPDHITVFSFPVKRPQNAVYRDDRSAIEQLELWLTYQRHYCEHKPSVTIYVKEHEWMEVGAWVYEHFDEVSGVSFLPHSDHSYKQAPYQECSEEYYTEFVNKIPKNVDWSLLSKYESYDQTTGVQTLACTGNNCEL